MKNVFNITLYCFVLWLLTIMNSIKHTSQYAKMHAHSKKRKTNNKYKGSDIMMLICLIEENNG